MTDHVSILVLPWAWLTCRARGGQWSISLNPGRDDSGTFKDEEAIGQVDAPGTGRVYNSSTVLILALWPVATQSVYDVACPQGTIRFGGYVRMGRFIPFAIFVTCFLVTGSASATTYYLDYVNGLDSNSGTSKTTPWAHAPGMVGCTATCASVTPQPGDRFILRGGVTWHHDILTWNWQWNGSSGNPIYVGVDQTWFTGASWTRPILNGDGTFGNSGPFIQLGSGRSWVTIDNIEFTGLFWTGVPPYGQVAYLNIQNATNSGFTNLYMHGWSHGTYASGTRDGAYGIVGQTGFPAADSNAGSYVDHFTCDGTDTDQASLDCNYAGTQIIRFSIARNVCNGFVGSYTSFHDNLIENIHPCFDPGNHGNGMESNTSRNAVIYNNVFRHTTEVTLWEAPCCGATSYIWNNVIYDTAPANVILIGNPLSGGGGRVEIYNNTVECGPNSDPNASCINSQSMLISGIATNNHFISRSANIVTGPFITRNNIVQTGAAANAEGYTMANNFAPTASGKASVGAALNLTASCSITAKAGSLATLCDDTTFANTRTTLARPATSAWDAGAYQYSLLSPTRPDPPTNLRIIP